MRSYSGTGRSSHTTGSYPGWRYRAFTPSTRSSTYRCRSSTSLPGALRGRGRGGGAAAA